MNISFDPDELAKGTDHLQVEMVRDEVNNLIIEVPYWIGEQTEGYISKLRGSIRLGEAKFTCFYCGHPVLLRKHCRGGHFFAHKEKTVSEKANCLYQQAGVISAEDRDRIRYQGQREGLRHIRTKNLIKNIVESDPNFSSVCVEKVWKTFQDGWRKPDVSAVYNGIKIVFEAQISNTYPQVVAERTDFYKKQDCILIWIYDSINDSDWRTLHSDNFCANGQHIFGVDDECLSASRSNNGGGACFKIYTQRPDVAPYKRKDGKWLLKSEAIKKCDIIPFSKLNIDTRNQTATFFDIELEKWRVEHKILCAIVRADGSLDGDISERLENSLRVILGGEREIRYETIVNWAALICALESARLSKPIGTKYENIYSAFNSLYDHYPKFIFAFAEKIKDFGHTIETASGKWKERLTSLNAGRYEGRKALANENLQVRTLVEKILASLY